MVCCSVVRKEQRKVVLTDNLKVVLTEAWLAVCWAEQTVARSVCCLVVQTVLRKAVRSAKKRAE